MSDNANFFDCGVRPALATPDAPCLLLADGGIVTYGDLDRLSARFAHLLRHLGCVPGTWVAVCVEKSPQSLALYLACLRAGLVFLPLNTAYKPAELTYFLGDAKPHVFVCPPAMAASFGHHARALGVPHVLDMDEHGGGSLASAAAGLDTHFPEVHRRPDELAAVLYTSGTTGRPKGATISCRAVAYAARTLGSLWGFSRDDVLLHALPIFHGHGLFVACNVALAAGARMLFQPRFHLDTVLAALPTATAMMGVPTFYHRILGDPRFTRETFAHLRLVTCGSAPLLPEAQAEFAARFGHDILQRYGTTETMILTSNPLHGERRPGSVGHALPGVELRITDGDDRPLDDGEIGMIQVRGDGLFSGYWGMPEKTAEDFTTDGFFRTGDLGTRSADGYVAITGRAKDLVISGGYNVYPAEVEAVLNEFPGIAESAVIGVPHPDFGEAVTAIVIARSDGDAVVPDAVIRHAKERLANHKVPKFVVVVDDFPRNALGKIQKNLLRETYAGLADAHRA
jgi:malonyl-CoA/methylmalonyl-CoA synthetase